MHVRGRQKANLPSSSAARVNANSSLRQHQPPSGNTTRNSHPPKYRAKNGGVLDSTDRTASDHDEDDNDSCMAVMVRPPSMPVDIDDVTIDKNYEEDGTVAESVAAFSVATGYVTQVDGGSVAGTHTRSDPKKSSLKKQTTPPREQKRRVQFDAPTNYQTTSTTTATTTQRAEATPTSTLTPHRSAAAIFAALEEMDQQFTTKELLEIERREMEQLARQQELRHELFAKKQPSSTHHVNNKTGIVPPNSMTEEGQRHESDEDDDDDDDDEDVVSILEGNFSTFLLAKKAQESDQGPSEKNTHVLVRSDMDGETPLKLSTDNDEEKGEASKDTKAAVPVTTTESNLTGDDSMQQGQLTYPKSCEEQTTDQQKWDLEQPECAPVSDTDEEADRVKFETRSRRICCGLVLYMGFLLVTGMAIGTVCGLGYCTNDTWSSSASQPSDPDESLNDLVFTTTVELRAAVIAYLKDEPDEFPMRKWDVSRIHDFSNLFDVTRTNITSFTGTGKHDIGTWNMSSAVNLDGMFRGCTNFNANLTLWDTSKVESMIQTFENCTRFEGIGLQKWNTSNIRDLSATFQRAGSFNGDLSTWQTGKVTSMYATFSEAFSFESDISRWDTSSCRNFSYMFYSIARFNSDLNSWNVSAAEDMSFMFNECTNFNQDLKGWDTSRVTTMAEMFEQSGMNGDISNWNVENVQYMNAMFDRTSFSGDLSRWKTSSLLDMSHMFRGNEVFNSDLSNFDVSKVTSMYKTFHKATLFNGNVSGFDTRSVTDFTSCFDEAISFNQALPWNTSSATSMSRMFNLASSFEGEGLQNWDTSYVESIQSIFDRASAFRGDVSSWNTGRVQDMSYAFYGSPFDHNVSFWNTEQVTTMKSMFNEASAFNGDLSKWDTSRVLDMSEMFEQAESFQGNGLENWNVENVIFFSSMFEGAVALNNSGISEWTTNSAQYMDSMFSYAASFDGNLSTWDTSNVLTTEFMFSNATSFQGEGLENWNVGNVETFDGMFDGASSLQANLCTWGVQLADYESVYIGDTMFRNTMCPEFESPTGSSGPWCQACQ